MFPAEPFRNHPFEETAMNASKFLVSTASALMVVGGIGVLLSLVFWGSWGGFGRSRTEVRRDGAVVREDRYTT